MKIFGLYNKNWFDCKRPFPTLYPFKNNCATCSPVCRSTKLSCWPLEIKTVINKFILFHRYYLLYTTANIAMHTNANKPKKFLSYNLDFNFELLHARAS